MIKNEHNMAKYNWNFANVGGVTRVRIQSAEDIRHLGELDKKMWTVLSCPTTGLEISSDSLSLMDLDGDGKLRVKEVIATAEYLCGALKDPETLFEQKDELEVGNITEEAIKVVAEKLAKGGVVSLADVQAAIDGGTFGCGCDGGLQGETGGICGLFRAREIAETGFGSYRRRDSEARHEGERFPGDGQADR